MNILFISPSSVSSNSSGHIINLAKELALLGFDVAIAVPTYSSDDKTFCPSFAATTYYEAADFKFLDGRGPDAVHAWTPRQLVTKITREICEKNQCPYFVHLEDNEHVITSAYLGISVEQLAERSSTDFKFEVPNHCSHPSDMRQFMNEAAGVTVLIDRLLEFKPDKIPGIVIWPAAEDTLFRPQIADPTLRTKLGIPDKTKVVVYHGNVHPANVAEVRTLYLAIAALARSGTEIVLVRLGTDYDSVVPPNWPDMRANIIQVPFQPREEIPRYLALADVLVQPGRIDGFNSYRFPSKLPEFLAMGRPVILPAANVGLKMKPDQEAVVLNTGDAIEIAEGISRILSNEKLAETLCIGSRSFYERTLSWKNSGMELMRFYDATLRSANFDDMQDERALIRVARHYAEYKIDKPLSYATVMDFCDSVDRLRALSTINQDLKDAQRPWVFKVILGSVPPGGKLLEIGAGDPWVACLLSRLGYDVTVVDPYDGRDRGPNHFEQFKSMFPKIQFIRGLFPSAMGESNTDKFDCIYSISVLEHLPPAEISSLITGIAAFSKSSTSPTIHAVDHVHLGPGADSHIKNLTTMVNCFGIDGVGLAELRQAIDQDPDTYFLSAEAHNRWRGNTAYSNFPMRRCVSIQICSQAGKIQQKVEFSKQD